MTSRPSARRALLALALLFVLSALPLARQARDVQGGPLPAGTAVLNGRIVSDDSGARPIRRATVTINASEIRGARSTVTDDDGQFWFRALPPGRYSLSAAKPAWLTTYYGSKRAGRPPAQPIALTAGQQLAVTLKMPHGAAIAGVVSDQNGRPQANVRMQVLESRVVNGERVLTSTQASGLGATDDRGAYRVYGLAPGEYVIVGAGLGNQGDVRQMTEADIQFALRQVQQAASPAAAGIVPGMPNASQSAGPQPGPTVGFASVYYPGTTEASTASTIAVAAGEERTGVDFAMQLVPVAKIEGVVRGPDGQVIPSVQLNLVSSTASGPGLGSTGSLSIRDGKFTYSGVAPGQYTLTARTTIRPGVVVQGDVLHVAGAPLPPPPPPPPPPDGRPAAAGAMNLWALMDLSVSGRDISDLSLNLLPGMTLSGRVVFDGTTLPPPQDLTRVRISINPAPSNAPSSGMPLGIALSQSAKADGTFVIEGVTPGRYRISASALAGPGGPGGWAMKSVTVNARDTLDSFLEVRPSEDVNGVVVTFTDRSTEISGTLLDSAGRPAPTYIIVVFSSNRTFWTPQSRRTRQTRPGSDGKFTIGGLPPGEYHIAAVTDLESTDLYDGAFLEQVAASSYKITLAEGEKIKQDLALTGGGQ